MRECKSGAVVAAVVAVLEKQQKNSPSGNPSKENSNGENGNADFLTQLKERKSLRENAFNGERDIFGVSRNEKNGGPSAIPTAKLYSSTRAGRFCSPFPSKPMPQPHTLNPSSVTAEEEAKTHDNVVNKKIINCSFSNSKNTRLHQPEHDVDENFRSAVKDFDSVAEDVEKICFTTDSLKRNKEGKVELQKECVQNGLDKGHGSPRLSDSAAFSSNLDDIGSSSDDSSEAISSDSDEERVHLISEGLATIAEEERNTASSAQSSSREIQDDDSSLEDDSTLKGQNEVWSGSVSNQGSTSDLSSTSSEPNLKDTSSTRCTNDFQWIRKEEPQSSSSPIMDDVEPVQLSSNKPPINRPIRDKTPRREKTAPGSLDRRRHHHPNRQERDQKSRSSHIKSPPRLEDYQQPCQNWCCNPYDGCFENFNRRHERLDPQRYGSSPMLDHRFVDSSGGINRGSHPDIYGCRHDMQSMGCCSYHMAPPPCYFYGDRNFHWAPPPYPKPGEQDEKFRKIQFERDNLQLQVQVLTEQIEAQGDKIADLEKILHDKKLSLSDAEDKLQREMLSRSSLETQKLELMSVMSELKLRSAALERENLELRSIHFNNNPEVKKPPVIPRMSSQPQLTSTPVQQHSSQGLRISPSPSPVGAASNTSRVIDASTPLSHDLYRPKTPPSSYKRQIDIKYGSLPRQQFLSNGSTLANVDTNANPRKGVAFGRGLTSFLLVGGRQRGFSVPNLAESEKIILDESSKESPGSPTLSFNKNKGIKKIFNKIKRSGSGNLEDIAGIGEFQRGGVRATASARLGWSEPQLSQKPDKPFSEWDTENICDWLQDMGLDQYIPEAKRWVKNGQQLLETGISEIEKELNIKNPLHRKKLQLALIDSEENSSSDLYLSQAGKLDTSWVLRWLDDTGLPQHKENFLINRVDGRVLHRLTMDDLALLHVTSLLHVASIKRGIQVLRENNYEPSCLQRRSLPDDPVQTTKQISLWTTHRVMEWLRVVDLAEYAPNLRGAGVHGGLMVLEPKFTSELLASLLAIPPSKTLLRRHLNTHFKELLGKDIIQDKREAESMMGYIPLTPSSKLKVAKKSQFSLKRKKSKGEADYGDLVCPLNPEKQSDDEDKPRGRGCLSSR